jgi:2'-5' RNA ligase
MNRRQALEVWRELQELPAAFVPLLRSVKRLFRPRRGRIGPTLEIAIVLPVSDEVQNYARRQQLALLQAYRIGYGISAPPHISLKLGFKVTDIAPIEAYFDELVATMLPLQVDVRNFGFFDEGIVFLDVAADARLDAARRRVLADLKDRFSIEPHPIEGDAFRFHVTLAHGLSAQDLESARQSLRGVEATFTFTTRSLALLCYVERQWVTYKHAVLRSAAP